MSSPLVWLLGGLLRTSPPLLHQAVCFHFFGPSITIFLCLPPWKLSLTLVSGVSLYLATCSQPAGFISPFLLSLERHVENGAYWPLRVAGRGGAGINHFSFWGLRFLLPSLRRVVENSRITNRQPEIWPAGEWSGVRVLKAL